MKPSERIAEIFQELNPEGRFRSTQVEAVIRYLDEVHRFEHPDWEAECARIVRERPGIVALKAWEGTTVVGCPEEGQPFEDEPRLFIRAIVADEMLPVKDFRERYAVLIELERDLERFTKISRVDPELRTETEHRNSRAIDEHNRAAHEWPALAEVPA